MVSCYPYRKFCHRGLPKLHCNQDVFNTALTDALFSVLDHVLAYTLLGTLSVSASFDKGQVLVFIC